MVNRIAEGLPLILPLLASAVLLCSSACSTPNGTGTPTEGGIGNLVGSAGGTHRSVNGQTVGTGVGYVIGDPTDEAKAKEMTANGTPAQVTPLGGSRWTLVSVKTTRRVDPYESKVLEFRPDARVITTTTRRDGKVVVFDESYRVVGSTLIVNKPGYLVNARYRFEGDRLILAVTARYHNDGDRLILEDPGFSAVLKRTPA